MTTDTLILVVEDDPAFGPALHTALTRRCAPAAVELVVNYGRAVQRLLVAPLPDVVVVTDFRLTDARTGVDLACWIRQQPALRHARIVLHSGTQPDVIAADAAKVPTALDAVFDRVVPKNNGVRDLVVAVQEMVQQQHGSLLP